MKQPWKKINKGVWGRAREKERLWGGETERKRQAERE